MSHLKPKNEIEMLKVDGVGETKLKKYGKAFLEAINKHVWFNFLIKDCCRLNCRLINYISIISR